MSKIKFDSRFVNRLLLVLIGLLVVGTLFGANELVNNLKSKGDQLVSLKAKDMALQQEQIDLVKAKAEVKKYTGLEAIAEAVVPQDKNQAEAVREIVKLATENNINLTAITFPSSNLGAAVAPTTPTSSTPSSSSTTPSASLSQLTAVLGIPGVYTLPITVQDSNNAYAVSYSSFYNFLTSLENNRRTSLVSSLSIQPLSTGNVTFSLTINEYIKPL